MPDIEPQRSCISCKSVQGKQELLRFVLAPDRTIVPDLRVKLPGRGAYTCMKISCLRNAATKKQFARAFKGEVLGADADNLIAQVKSRIEERVSSYVSLANKAGKVVSGSDQVVKELSKTGSLGLLFIASDISLPIGDKMSAMANRAGIDHVQLFTKEQLGSYIGKELRSVVAILQSGFVEPLKQELKKYRNFFEEG